METSNVVTIEAAAETVAPEVAAPKAVALPPELQAVLDRLQGGESLQAIELSLLPGGERELLRLCALARVFDEELVEQVLRPLAAEDGFEVETQPAFSDIIGREDVEAVPRREGGYRFSARARQQYFETWWEGAATPATSAEIPPALRAASRVLADFYGQQDGAQHEVLYHLLAVDGSEARQLFDTLYAGADARFDLARCQDLLELLEERRALLDDTFKARLEDRHSYRRARSLWALAHDQSFYFYERKEPRARLEALLQDQTAWILQMHAPGGMGKTSFVRWILGRYCSPRRIPCARLDFDEFDPITLSQHPWYLFYHIAEQLNEQLPGSTSSGIFQGVFGGFFSKLREPAARLFPRSTPTPKSSSDPSAWISDIERQDLNRDVPILFRDTLAAARQNRPVLILLDTLEEMVLRPGTDLMAMVRPLAQVQESCTGLRLVLSGRHQATDLRPNGEPRVPDFFTEFAADLLPDSLPIELFSDEEAREFLLRKRGLAPGQHVETIIRRAEGNPLKLSFYADIVRAYPSITPKEFERHDPDLVYFIQRVVGRIPQLQVRWVLRYGAIPRRLTRAFLEDIMAPRLRDAELQNFQEDDPARGLEEFAREEDRRAFLSAQSTQRLSLDQLWEALGEYTSQYGWVSLGDDVNTFVFHGNVLDPMRRLLGDQPVARRLHQDAVAHYATRARAEPERWPQWMREAIYHIFQGQDSASAAAYWRECLRDTAVQGNPAWRRDLANEILGLEYIGDDDEPRQRFDGSPLIDRSTVIEACFEAAQAYAQTTRSESPSDEALNLAKRSLDRAEELEQRWNLDVLPPEGVIALKARLLIARRDYDGALRMIESFIDAAIQRTPFPLQILAKLIPKGAPFPLQILAKLIPKSAWHDYARLGVNALKFVVKDRVALQTLYAEALAHSNRSGEASEHYQQALALAQDADDADELQWDIRLKLARHHAESGSFVEASQQYEALSSLNPPTPTDEIELTRSRADTIFALGHWEQAQAMCDARLRSADAAPPDTADMTNAPLMIGLHLLHARILLALRDPLGALATLSTARRFDKVKSEDNAAILPLRAECHEMEGIALVQTREFDLALKAWNQALEIYQAGGLAAQGSRCRLRRAELQLRELGQRDEARSLLHSSARLFEEDNAEEKAHFALLLAESHLSEGATTAARVAGEQALAAVEGGTPQLRSRVAAQTLALFGETMAVSCLPRLVESLHQVEPSEARLPLLDAFSRWISPPCLEAAQAATLLDLLPTPTPNTTEYPHFALLFADVLRVAQRIETAKALLENVENELRTDTPFMLLDWLRAKDRVGWDGDDPVRWSERLKSSTAAILPITRGAALLEHAERLEKVGGADGDLDKILQETQAALEQPPQTALFLARLAFARARFESRRGDDEAFARFTIEAETLYRHLNDHDALERLKMLRSKPELGKPESASLENSGITVEVDALNDELDSDFKTNVVRINMVALSTPDGAQRLDALIQSRIDGQSATRTVSANDDPVLNTLLRVSSSDFYSYQFLKQMDTSAKDAGEMLGRLLFTEAERGYLTSLAEPHDTDLRLEIDHPLLQPIPWELMWLDSGIPAELQHLLRIRHAYRGPLRPAPPQDRPPAERRRALILLPDNNRGEAFRQYRQGFQVEILPGFYGDKVESALLKMRPDVIHIVAMLNESPTLGGTYLDFLSDPQSSKRGGRESQGLSAERLVDILYQARTPRPVVILDVPRPPTRLDTLRQLFLRNHFASTLFDSPVVEAIIGAGFDTDNRVLTRLLLESLTGGRTLGEAVNTVRRSGWEWGAATALFARDPDFRVAEPRSQ